MAVPFKDYCLIRNNACISYFGACDEYLVLLDYCLNFVKEQLPGIDLTICCNDNKKHLILFNKVLSFTEFSRLSKKSFALMKEIRCNMITHPISGLLLESNINITSFPKNNSKEKTFFVNCQGQLPTHSTNPDVARSYALSNGFQEVSSKEEASWVLGVENTDLSQAAISGKKITLYSTGIGTNLFQKLFPLCEIKSI